MLYNLISDQAYSLGRMISIRDGQQIDRFESSIDELTEAFDAGTKSYDDAIRKQTGMQCVSYSKKCTYLM